MGIKKQSMVKYDRMSSAKNVYYTWHERNTPTPQNSSDQKQRF